MKKHIFIGGSSFSGSTLVSLMLGSLPDIANINESHWLISDHANIKNPSKSKTLISLDNMDQFTHCRLCGESCQYWDVDFRRGLQLDKIQWLEKLADRMQSEVIVTADKSLDTLRYLTGQKEIVSDFIILFKDPWRFLRSWMKRKYKHQNPRKALNYWSRTYEELLKCHTQGKKIIVNLGDMQNDPVWFLKTVCNHLDLTFDGDAIRYWEKEQHYIGGNFNVYEKLSKLGSESMQIQPVSEMEENKYIDHIVYNHGWAQKVYKQLCEQRILNKANGVKNNFLPNPVASNRAEKIFYNVYSQLYHLAYKTKNLRNR